MDLLFWNFINILWNNIIMLKSEFSSKCSDINFMKSFKLDVNLSLVIFISLLLALSINLSNKLNVKVYKKPC